MKLNELNPNQKNKPTKAKINRPCASLFYSSGEALEHEPSYSSPIPEWLG